MRVFASEMRVFPNPSSGQIQVGGTLEPGALLRVISPMGKILLQRRIQPDEIQVPLDLSNLATGLYSIEMIGENGITTKKVVLE